MPNLNALGILPSAPIEPGQLQCPANKRSAARPILGMKEVYSLAENPALEIRLDPEALAGMQPAETLLQFLDDRLVGRGDRVVPRSFGELKIHLSPVSHLHALRAGSAAARKRD